jgi:hypothetical protein
MLENLNFHMWFVLYFYWKEVLGWIVGFFLFFSSLLSVSFYLFIYYFWCVVLNPGPHACYIIPLVILKLPDAKMLILSFCLKTFLWPSKPPYVLCLHNHWLKWSPRWRDLHNTKNNLEIKSVLYFCTLL